jgi:hypothetical protein
MYIEEIVSRVQEKDRNYCVGNVLSSDTYNR